MGILETAVAIVDSVTQNLNMQAYVMHSSLASVDGAGHRSFSPAVQRRAIVNRKQQLVKDATGQMVMSQANVTFPRPVSINILDRIVLPDGTTGPILNTDGFVANVNPIMSEVYLG